MVICTIEKYWYFHEISINLNLIFLLSLFIFKNSKTLFVFRCKRKCYRNISATEQDILFQKFKNFETKNEQDSYLQSLISIAEVHRRRRRIPKTDTAKPDREVSYVYHLSTLSGKFQVCKKAFVNMHAVTDGRVRRLCNLLLQGKPPLDKRGKTSPGNSKPGYVVDAIEQHIASFPVKISHYSSREYKYLSEKLNVSTMFSMFKNKNPELTEVNYRFYQKVFKENFSLSFGRPQIDTCCKCEEFDVKIKSCSLNERARKVAEAEKAVHERRAKKFFSKIKEIGDLVKSDKTGQTGAICIDFMQNIYLPCIPVQEVFYLRQLTVSVFSIHNLKDDSATFFIYHEGIGTKGPNEVCSFLCQYFDTEMKNVESLHIFSDGSGAQNKNHTMIRLMSTLTTLHKFKNIEQYYPIRGHSYLPCDRDFALLKKNIKKCDRVYTIKEYVELIVTSSRKGVFSVVVPNSEDIIDFKKWWPQFFKRNMLSTETTGTSVPKDQKIHLKPSQFMHYTYSSNTPGLVVARNYINGAVLHHFRLLKPKANNLSLATHFAYPEGRIPINNKKIDDIRKLMNYIPHEDEIQDFYKEILAWPTYVCDKDHNLNHDDDN